jgi:hypothetical protein
MLWPAVGVSFQVERLYEFESVFKMAVGPVNRWNPLDDENETKVENVMLPSL